LPKDTSREFIEGFDKDKKVIEGYLNLIAICYCFKSHADCRDNHRYKNGKSPLELAGVSIKGLDCMRFALKNRPS